MACRILSTKKLLPNQRHFLLNAGLKVIEANFIATHLKPFDINAVNQNLVFTSRNGFMAFLAHKLSGVYVGSNVFCIGLTTHTLIQSYGFKVVASADNAQQLAEIIIDNHNTESFTFFSGSLRRDTLPVLLHNADVAFNEVQVYDTQLTPHKITVPLDGLLFYSPSGVESYLKENTITTEICFCIGATTAQALQGITTNIITANQPSIENVIVQVRNYFNELNLNNI